MDFTKDSTEKEEDAHSQGSQAGGAIDDGATC